MSLVVPRMIGALAGFIDRHGTWPTKMVVPFENWVEYRDNPRPVEESYQNDATRAMFARLELVPVPEQMYLAFDDEGHGFRYGEEGPENWWATVNGSLCGPRLKDGELTVLAAPHEDAYVIPGTLLAAGAYPGSHPKVSKAASRKKLERFLDAQIDTFVDLTTPEDDLSAYEPLLRELACARGLTIERLSLPIRDMDVCGPDHMRRILGVIDERLAGGRRVYVHCWGGIGRTGTVIGCWLVRHGHGGEEALERVNALFRTMSPAKVRKHASSGSPQTERQRAMVRGWAAHEKQSPPGGREAYPRPAIEAAIKDLSLDAILTQIGERRSSHRAENTNADWALIAPAPDIDRGMRDRMRGALIGLAVGDAVGTAVEFRARGSFAPVKDMVGGGPFRLQPGQWTDDTSMALCLAESLIERRDFDPHDQMERYLRWWRQGHLSSTGAFFDIGNTCAEALRAFEQNGEPYAGSTDEWTAGNGSLMRLAPIPIFYFGRAEEPVEMAAESSRTTHGAAVAIDACRYLAALITGALRGASKDKLLSGPYEPEAGYWAAHPLHPAIAGIAGGSFRKPREAVRGTTYAADALEAAIWAFSESTEFQAGCLLAVNLGDDADTTAAIYGQLAGAFYGESAIPGDWRAKLAHKALLDRYAESLFQLSFGDAGLRAGRRARAREYALGLIAAAGGVAVEAIRHYTAEEERAKAQMGEFEYYMNGPLSGDAVREEVLLQLRIEAGLALA